MCHIFIINNIYILLLLQRVKVTSSPLFASTGESPTIDRVRDKSLYFLFINSSIIFILIYILQKT